MPLLMPIVLGLAILALAACATGAPQPLSRVPAPGASATSAPVSSARVDSTAELGDATESLSTQDPVSTFELIPERTVVTLDPTIEAAIEAMRQVDSYRFTERIEYSQKRGFRVDAGEQTLDGAYKAPDKLQRMGLFTRRHDPYSPVPKSEESAVELGYISIGNMGYALEPETGEWKALLRPFYSTLLSSEIFFNGRFFKSSDAPHELFITIASEAEALSHVGQEIIDGVTVSHLSSVSRKRFRYVDIDENGFLVTKRVPDGEGDQLEILDVGLWIGLDDHLPRRMVISYARDHGPCRDCTTGYISRRNNHLRYEFSDYDRSVTIDAPAVSTSLIDTAHGPMEVFESERAPLSIQRPAGWRKSARTSCRPPTSTYKFGWCSPSGERLEFDVLIFDADWLEEYEFVECSRKSPGTRFAATCEPGLEAVDGVRSGEVPLTDYVDSRRARLSGSTGRGKEWVMNLLSRHRYLTAQGLPAEALEFSREYANGNKEMKLYLFFMHKLSKPVECPASPVDGCSHARLSVVLTVPWLDGKDMPKEYAKLRGMFDYISRTARVDDQ